MEYGTCGNDQVLIKPHVKEHSSSKALPQSRFDDTESEDSGIPRFFTL